MEEEPCLGHAGCLAPESPEGASKFRRNAPIFTVNFFKIGTFTCIASSEIFLMNDDLYTIRI